MTKQEILDYFSLIDFAYNESGRLESLARMIDELLKEHEAVVRCKDCKWFIKPFENEGRCIKHDNGFHDPDWFCADGELKD